MDAEYEAERAQRLISIAQEWTKETLAQLKAEGHRLGVKDTGLLLRAMRYRIRKRLGRPEVLSLKMKRYGIFSITGTGRGVKAATAHITSSRKPRDFYSPVIDKQLAKLEEKLLQEEAALFIKHYPLNTGTDGGQG